MNKKQAGFTLIELVVVLVLLGIIGAVATARFQDLSGDAADAAAQGVAAEISSGGAINYAARTLDITAGTAVSGAAVACDTYANNMLAAGAITIGATSASGQDIYITPDSDTANCTGGAGTDTCQIIHTRGSTAATFTVYCIN